MRINEISKENRPREKALRSSVTCLSNQELLALIIGSGVKGHSALEIAGELLSSNLNSLNEISKTPFESFKRYQGLNKNNALKLLATFELHNRLNFEKNSANKIIKSADDVYRRYKYLENYEQEVLIILLLDGKLKLKKERLLYKGTYDSFSINVSEVLKELVLGEAKFFILIHNHPDGSNKPSDEDILSTNAINKSSRNLGMKLMDHIIVYKNGYYSMRKDLNNDIKRI